MWFINEVNYVLARLCPKVSENGWEAISKKENTSEYKYDQAKYLSILTRGYIANNTNTEVRHWGSEVKSLK